jgi:hypothetical protein
MKAQGNQPIALFKRHPRTDPKSLVMHNQVYRLGELSEAYYESAVVISSKFDGQATSDTFLLPYLFLMRHAFELSLKDGIIVLKKVRIEHFTADPEVAFNYMSPIDYVTDIGHNLMKLFNEFKREYNSFDFMDKFPKGVETALNLLHQADKSSTEFRYGTEPQDEPSHIDSASLCAELSTQFQKLSTVIDYACGTCSYLPIARYQGSVNV